MLGWQENADKGFTGRDLSQRAREAGVRLRYTPYHESQNKHAKISTVVKWHFEDLRFVQQSDENYLSQLTEYMEGVSLDDCPDSLASCLLHAYNSMGADKELAYNVTAAYGGMDD